MKSNVTEQQKKNQAHSGISFILYDKLKGKNPLSTTEQNIQS